MKDSRYKIFSEIETSKYIIKIALTFKSYTNIMLVNHGTLKCGCLHLEESKYPTMNFLTFGIFVGVCFIKRKSQNH